MSAEGSFGSTATATTTIISPSSTGGGGTQGSVDLFGKKKRGRPRKYDSDGNLRLAYSNSTGVTTPPPPGFSLSPSSPSEFSSKRGRGRPPGSGNWQLLASLGKFKNCTTQFDGVMDSEPFACFSFFPLFVRDRLFARKCRKIGKIFRILRWFVCPCYQSFFGVQTSAYPPRKKRSFFFFFPFYNKIKHIDHKLIPVFSIVSHQPNKQMI